MKLVSSRRRVVTAAALVLLALFIVRPGVSRLKARIANSISRAVARPVEIGSVHLRFLPPGFDLENLVIYEDPAFGAEPMLRAPEVTASVHLVSLLRGHLDIARLELTEPSLNLVRRQDGHWNWAALLERSSRIPLAPTAKSKAETRPGFPYIEASSGRINFKSGQEKKSYALLNADFSLWQESENTWGARLKANPLRTDMSLSDTGMLRMTGTWQRADKLRETPLQFSLQWDGAQLGQLTKLLSGNDRGWRGEVLLEGSFTGRPSAMRVSADATIQNFHRYDISTKEALRLATHCDGTYASEDGMMRNILCSSPVGDGMITLRGEAGLSALHRVALTLNVENVPVSAAAQLARRAKKDFPSDLVSTGSVQGDFAVNLSGPSASAPEFRGHGEISDLRLRSTKTKAEFVPRSIPFALSGQAYNFSRSRIDADAQTLSVPEQLHIEFGPFPVSLGPPSPAQIRGWVARSGYGIAIRGEGEVSHLLRTASLLGLPASKISAEGAAQIDLQISGSWAGDTSEPFSGFHLPEITGTVQLRNVRATLRAISDPLEISSAQLLLTHDGVRVEKLSAQAAAARWTGTLNLPRGCGTPTACLVHFNLKTEEIGLSDLTEWLGPRPAERRWYQILSSTEARTPSFLEDVRASGRITAGRLVAHKVVASRVSASVDLERGKLRISDLRADLLGGTHHGDWHADFTGATPVYAGSGTFTGLSLQQISAAMGDSWVSGTAGGMYQLTAAGADSAAFWRSAEGEVQFDLRDAVFSHITLASDDGPLEIPRWQGVARLRSTKIEIDREKFFSSGAPYEVSGTGTLGRLLDFRLTRFSDLKSSADPLVYRIAGTVAESHVTLAPPQETRAQLKP